MHELNLSKYFKAMEETRSTRESGKVTRVQGVLVRGYVPGATIGSVCAIRSGPNAAQFLAEVVGFDDRHVLMMPLGEMRGVGLGSKITLLDNRPTVKVGPQLLGRILNGLGEPIDQKPHLSVAEEVPLYAEVENPLNRVPIRHPLSLGVRAIDGLITVGLGQRISITAGSGVGKSVLMGMIAKNTNADVNVIAMIGERGREVREFVEQTLGPEGLRRSVVVAVTSDQSPLLRMRGAFLATSIAEYFCGQGKHVLLMMDSVTRFAMAQREIGLSIGEPPTTKGYTPSVFSMLPKLLERAGNFENGGSITGLYTVLVEADDPDDPIGDSVRSIVDGHIVLSRKIAQSGHYPAIDVLASLSRVMPNIVSKEHFASAIKLRDLMSTYKEAEDLINIGAYKNGANAKIDLAIRFHEPIANFLKQAKDEKTDLATTQEILSHVGG